MEKEREENVLKKSGIITSIVWHKTLMRRMEFLQMDGKKELSRHYLVFLSGVW